MKLINAAVTVYLYKQKNVVICALGLCCFLLCAIHGLANGNASDSTSSTDFTFTAHCPPLPTPIPTIDPRATPTPTPAPTPTPVVDPNAIPTPTPTATPSLLATDKTSITINDPLSLELLKSYKLFVGENGHDPDTSVAYVFHLMVWDGNGITSSSWYAYRYNSKKKQFEQKWNPPINGDEPLLYGTDTVQVFSVQVRPAIGSSASESLKMTTLLNNNLPKSTLWEAQTTKPKSTPKPGDNPSSAPTPTPIGVATYAVALTGKTPENFSDAQTFALAISGLGGSSSSATSGNTGAGNKIHLTIYDEKKDTDKPLVCISALPLINKPDKEAKKPLSLPYDAAVNITPGEESNTNAPNNIARTLHALDREWWDISIAMNVYPVQQTQISLVTGKVTSSIAKRVNAYGFIDIYPFSAWYPKNDWLPHVAGGIPLSGQPLHRPFVGLSEPIPGLQKLSTFPISVFGGFVFMRERDPATLAVGAATDAPTFNANLRTRWIRKPMWGVDLPLTKLLSKINPIKVK